MQPKKRAFAGLLALLLLAVPEPARADAKAEAQASFSRGVERFESGDFAGALQDFEQADRVHHSPAIIYNIARARESLGQAQAAADAYEAYLREAGSDGELSQAAVVAVAEIKKKCTLLRIASRPAGAKVYVDGVEARDRAPVNVLLFAGHHRVAVELGSWKDAREYDAAGGGNTDAMSFARAEPKKVKPPKKRKPPPKAPRPAPPEAKGPVLDGLMGGLGVTLYGYRFVGNAEETDANKKTTADEKPTGIVFGPCIDVGWALSSRVALLLRGFGGLGSAEGELASMAAGAPALIFRASDSWWAGGGVLFGGSRADSDATTKQQNLAAASDSQITYRTDFALGPMLELSYVVGENSGGQWLVSVMPSALVTTLGEQSTIFVPVMFGHRWL